MVQNITLVVGNIHNIAEVVRNTTKVVRNIAKVVRNIAKVSIAKQNVTSWPFEINEKTDSQVSRSFFDPSIKQCAANSQSTNLCFSVLTTSLCCLFTLFTFVFSRCDFVIEYLNLPLAFFGMLYLLT